MQAAMLLTLAELHLDAELHTGRQLPSNTPSDKSFGHLEACADWLALAQEAALLRSEPEFDNSELSRATSCRQSAPADVQSPEQSDAQQGVHEDRARLVARFSWASARFADCRKDHDASTQHYTNVLIALEYLQCNAAKAAKLAGIQLAPTAVTLSHCQHDTRISSNAVLAKLQVLQLQEIIQEALAHLDAHEAPEALALLSGELLQDADLAEKASHHDPARFCASLKLLLVSHPSWLPRNLHCQSLQSTSCRWASLF